MSVKNLLQNAETLLLEAECKLDEEQARELKSIRFLLARFHDRLNAKTY